MGVDIVGKKFAHSGTSGDVMMSLNAIKLLGGGHLYLKLNNLDQVVQKYLGWPSAGFHSGRMTQKDFDDLVQLVSHQSYISGFSIWQGEEVDYDFDVMAAGHNIPDFPRNFSNLNARAMGLDTEKLRKELQISSWLECREPIKVSGKPVVVFRGPRYQEGNQVQGSQWLEWRDWGLSDQAVFVGLPADHEWFCKTLDIEIEHWKTETYWDMAQVMAGAEMVITSMSSPCAMALAMGKTTWIETRKNIEIERLEVNYPWRANVFYF